MEEAEEAEEAEEEKEEEEEEEVKADIKSNNPHLTGGEIQKIYLNFIIYIYIHFFSLYLFIIIF